MATPSPRLALLEPVGADTVAELRVAITNHATTLDGSILYSTGTLAARPASPTVAPAVYKGTDTGLTYWWDGAVWQPIQFLLNARLSAGGASTITAANGDLIELRSGDTCQMPATVAGAVVRVATVPDVVPTAPAIVSCTAAGGISFYGAGLDGATSFKLAGGGSVTVTLICNGSIWFVFGQPDTGWVTLTPTSANNITNAGVIAKVRVQGDRLQFCGQLANNGAALASGASVATIPAGVPLPTIDSFPTTSIVTGANVLYAAQLWITGSTIKFFTSSQASQQFPSAFLDLDNITVRLN